MTENAAAAPTSMEKLKAGIWDIHEGVTSGPKKPDPHHESIMSGTLPRHKYIETVKQRYLLQDALDKILRENRTKTPYLSKVVTDEQFHADKAAQDLRFFGVDPATVTPLPTTKRMIEYFKEVAARDPRLLLAIHYVIEGSNNGAMYISKAVKQAFNLEGTDGTYHLQPYGPAIRDKWRAFGESFNSLEYTPELLDEMVKVGRTTFTHMNDVNTESHQLGQEK